MVYLFIGSDIPSKEEKLNALKKELLDPALLHFNCDTLYARELELRVLQERLLALPVKAKKRLIIIKDSGSLKEECREYLASYVKKPSPSIALVFDFERREPRDKFIDELKPFAKTAAFKEERRVDAFMLGRAIEARNADMALRMLNELLKKGEKPKRIMGGLRYVFEKDALLPADTRRRLLSLLNCDIDIKTGRLAPVLAMERLVLGLCGFAKAKG